MPRDVPRLGGAVVLTPEAESIGLRLWAMLVGLWSVWLYGFVLIGLSFYATQMIPSFVENKIRVPIFRQTASEEQDNPEITILSAPEPFTGPVGFRQSIAIRSWLGLSPQIKVVLFSQDPSVALFAKLFGSRVLVDSTIDFTFLGTPFFHSMVERSRGLATDITVFINPETILLADFISTLNYANNMDEDWLLMAYLRNVSYFPFQLDDAGKHWFREDGKRMRLQELQEIIRYWPLNLCEDRMLIAWNSRNVPLHYGVLPPFLYGKGIHNHWIINEAVSSELRIVFDASWAISSFAANDLEYWSNRSANGSTVSGIVERSWEGVSNSHLGAFYGSLFFHEVNHTSLVKLFKCKGQYVFFGISEDAADPFEYQRIRLRSGIILQSWIKNKFMASLADIQLQNRVENCSLKDQLIFSPHLNFPFSLLSLLPKVADKNKTVILAVAGYSYKDMLMNWVCRLRRLLITNFLICALDHETYQFSILQGLSVFHDLSVPSNISYNDCHFGTKCFQRVTKTKSRMVLKILKMGYNVLLSDVDVYWFRNPLPLLYSFGPAFLVAQSDEYNLTGPINLPRRLNSGFYFAHSDGSTIAALEKVVTHAATSGLSEQPSFYDILCGENGVNRISDDRCMEPETNLTIHFLDRNLFPNGAYLDIWLKKNVKAACMEQGCFILHNNWINGRIKKLERQVLSGLWEYDSSKRMCQLN
ncbi:hypothetical protein K2173_005903 [Erythroxylum novogranatense]|uniref:Nucleotide-diphospho-sugar transferase domain-containing protein n=1 Tax=Erythroxylum novogranatense TaxID=1862640 RepID=A0AAV8U2Y7_9ROSI|nr:hypothetical protein K2173_005903 [Erythroxylum novogranatense]